MADKSEITIEQVFELLERWRHLPDYQLERRADIFFASFLPEVLRDHFQLDQSPVLIPEFPIRSREDRRPDRVDYLALKMRQSQDTNVCERAFLIELKTDMASIREEQRRHLERAAKKGLEKLIRDVLHIVEGTKEKGKYVHLLYRLSELGLVTGVHERIDALSENARPVDPRCDNWRGKASTRGKKFADELKGVNAAAISWPSLLEVVYVQPRSRNEIVFEEFACAIEPKGDLGKLFAKYIRKWAKCDAGSPNPRTLPSC